jgi:hypothetical protein
MGFLLQFPCLRDEFIQFQHLQPYLNNPLKSNEFPCANYKLGFQIKYIRFTSIDVTMNVIGGFQNIINEHLNYL